MFIGYRAWDKHATTPSYAFGHGLGYTDWTYESLDVTGTTATVRIRNTGPRQGRETIQLYLAPTPPDENRPTRWLAGFATIEAAPGETKEAVIQLPRRTF